MEERFPGECWGTAADARPTMGEIGLNHFAFTSEPADGAGMPIWQKSSELTSTAKMQALAVSASPRRCRNQLSIFAVTRQSTMSRTLMGWNLRVSPPPAPARTCASATCRSPGRPRRVRKVWQPCTTCCFRCSTASKGEYRAFISTLHKVLNNIRKHEI